MNTFKRIQHTVLLFAACMFLMSCASLPGSASKPILIEHPERFFWEIKGDKGSIYVLGTIHVADSTFYPLEENVLKAFNGADRLVGELGGKKDIEALLPQIQQYMLTHINTDPEKQLIKFLSEEELSVLKEELGEIPVQQLSLFKPWVMNMALSKLVMQETGLKAEEGIDVQLMELAGEKTIEALEPVEDQLKALSYGTFEQQMAQLHETIESLQNMEDSIKMVHELKQHYLSDDRKGLAQFLVHLMGTSSALPKEQQEEYIDLLFTQRNRRWAEKFNEYLNAGGNTFVFAGSGHFIGETSVFEIMRQEQMLK